MIVAIAVAPAIIILLELHDDEQRRDLGDVGDVAGDEDHRAIFADAAREGEREAGEQAPAPGRQHHAHERLQPRRAESGRGFLEFRLRAREIIGCTRAHDERQSDEDERDQNAPAA